MIDIDKARKICEAATPGPWERYENEPQYLVRETNYPGSEVLAGHKIAECSPKTDWSYGMISCCNNAAFIVFARTALPEALDEIQELRRCLDLRTKALNLYIEDCQRYIRKLALAEAVCEAADAVRPHRPNEQRPWVLKLYAEIDEALKAWRAARKGEGA